MELMLKQLDQKVVCSNHVRESTTIGDPDVIWSGWTEHQKTIQVRHVSSSTTLFGTLPHLFLTN